MRFVAARVLWTYVAEARVRRVSPANLFRRTAIRDTELSGQPIAEGDKVVAFLTSANRDEDVFAAAQEFDIGRDPNPHAGFSGGGPRYCLRRHPAPSERPGLLPSPAVPRHPTAATGPVL